MTLNWLPLRIMEGLMPTHTLVRSNAQSRYTGISDNQVMADVQLGSLAAKTELVRRFHSRMIRLAYRILRDTDRAADVVQSAWLHVFTHCRQFEFRSAVGSWIYRIVFNEALQAFNHRRREPRSLEALMATVGGDADTFPSHRPGPDDLLISREIGRHIVQALTQIVPRDIDLLRRFHHDGQTTWGIARQLNVSQGLVKSRIRRAHQTLREELRRTMPGDIPRNWRV